MCANGRRRTLVRSADCHVEDDAALQQPSGLCLDSSHLDVAEVCGKCQKRPIDIAKQADWD